MPKILPIQSFIHSGRGWEALGGVDKHILLAFKKAVKYNSSEASKKILSFVDRIFVLSIRTKNLEIFLQYKFMLILTTPDFHEYCRLFQFWI